MCVSPPPSPSVMWYDTHPHDRINKFYNIYMAVAVAIISGRDLTIEAHQPNKSKLVPYKLLLSHCKSHFKTVAHTYVTRWSASVIKVGVAYVY